MRKKSQIALEFLTTYVWVFFVIMVTLSTLYYFGIFDFSKYLPNKCVFPLQFKCLDFSLKPTAVWIKLTNNLGEDVTVTSIKITNDATPPVSCTTPATPFSWIHGTEKNLVFTSCSGGAYVADNRVELKISMSYYADNTPSKPIHLINGKINGRVASN